MKKVLLFVAVAGVCLSAGAQKFTYMNEDKHELSCNVKWNGLDSQTQNTFSKEFDIATSNQPILTALDGNTMSASLPNWMVSCLVTPNDFKGQINGQGKNLALPKYAEISQMFLQAVNDGPEKVGEKLNVKSYIYGYAGTEFSETDRKATYSATLAALEADENVFKSKGLEPCEFKFFNGKTLEDFIQSNYERPYTYLNEGNVCVTVNLTDAKNMHFKYGTFQAEAEKATIFRGKGIFTVKDPAQNIDVEPTIVTSSEYYNVDQFLGGTHPDIPFMIQTHRLPAFGLKYFTNDIRGTVVNETGAGIADATVKLTDETIDDVMDNATTVADGKFEFVGLNPAHTYEVSITTPDMSGVKINRLNFDKSKAEAQVKLAAGTFDQKIAGKENDIEIVFTVKPKIETAVDNVEAGKAVASVRYINMQGVESATPFAGVNVAVTTYADGSKTTTKVVK